MIESVKPKVATVDNVRIRTWDVQTIKRTEPRWDGLSDRAKMVAQSYLEPERDEQCSNVTTADLHEYLVDELDRDQSVDLDASHLALGTDSTAESSSDSSLGNEVFRTSVTDSIDKGSELLTSTFVDSTEANGNTIEELGLFSAASGGTMFNRSTQFSSIAKTNDETVTFDVSLTFANP